MTPECIQLDSLQQERRTWVEVDLSVAGPTVAQHDVFFSSDYL